MEASRTGDPLSCPRCGAEVASGQQYCLECGARLPVTDATDARPVRAGAAWAWPVLVTLVVAVVAAATVVAAQATRNESEEPFLVATTEQPALPPVTAGEPATTAVPTETEPAAETEPAPPPETTPPTDPPANELLAWPEGTDGWTVVLASIPESAGRAAAVRRARDAADAGLGEVGVLRSDRYPSLRPGYWVVFSGVHGSRAQAEQAVPAARTAGFDTAYPSAIAR